MDGYWIFLTFSLSILLCMRIVFPLHVSFILLPVIVLWRQISNVIKGAALVKFLLKQFLIIFLSLLFKECASQIRNVTFTSFTGVNGIIPGKINGMTRDK